MSAIKPLLDALAFVTFKDRVVGRKFKEALEKVDADMEEGGYEPSEDAEPALDALANEIEDALEESADEEVVNEADEVAEEDPDADFDVEDAEEDIGSEEDDT